MYEFWPFKFGGIACCSLFLQYILPPTFFPEGLLYHHFSTISLLATTLFFLWVLFYKQNHIHPHSPLTFLLLTQHYILKFLPWLSDSVSGFFSVKRLTISGVRLALKGKYFSGFVVVIGIIVVISFDKQYMEICYWLVIVMLRSFSMYLNLMMQLFC